MVDLDLDGSDEVFLRSKALTVLVHPRRGGTVVSLDHLDTSFALLDTFRRRREPEHSVLEALAAAASAGGGDERDDRHSGGPGRGPRQRPGLDDDDAPDDKPAASAEIEPDSKDEGGVALGAFDMSAHSIHDQVRMKEPGLERMLFVDAHPRAAFIDHFYPAGTGVNELIEGTAVELGDFAGSAYEITSVEEADEGPAVILRRTGIVAGREVSVRKSISLDRGERDTDGVTVSYVDQRRRPCGRRCGRQPSRPPATSPPTRCSHPKSTSPFLPAGPATVTFWWTMLVRRPPSSPTAVRIPMPLP